MMTDESPMSRTSSSSLNTTASPPGSLTSSPESGPGHKQPRQMSPGHNSNESHSSSGGRVYSPDNLPFSLSHIKKSPRIVLGNRLRKQQAGLTPATELKTRSQKDAEEKTEKPLSAKIEEMINMRLFYLGIIKDLADVNINNGKETTTSSPSVNLNFKTLKRRKEDLIHELNVVKGLIHESERRMVGLAKHINNLAVEINHIKTLTKEEEDRHMNTMRIYQVAMNRIAKETAGFEGLGEKSSTNFSTPPPVFFKRFNSGSFSNSSFSPSVASSSLSQTPPSHSSNMSFTPPSREVSFSGTLFALSGQLAEFSQGEFGSQLITKRISEGSDMERDLVWTELRLPGSLVSILVTGNQFTREVVLALASNSLALRKELVTTVEKEEKTIRMLEGGKEFLEEFSSCFTRL